MYVAWPWSRDMAEPCVKEQDRTWANGEDELRQTARCEGRAGGQDSRRYPKAPGTLSSQETCGLPAPAVTARTAQKHGGLRRGSPNLFLTGMRSTHSLVHLICKCNYKEISFSNCKKQKLSLPNLAACFKSLKSPLSATKALSFVVISR